MNAMKKMIAASFGYH
jgi:hypothetical protein